MRGPSLRAPPVLFAAIERALGQRLGWSPDRLADFSRSEVARRLRLAGKVAWYAGRLAPASGDPLADLAALPPLGRADLRQRQLFVDPRVPSAFLRVATTSGSSGQPLQILRDPTSVLWEEAFVRRQLRAFGWRPSWRTLSLRADGPRDPAGPVWDRDPHRSGTTRVAASRLDDRTTRAVVEHVRARGIERLSGYPSALLELARRIDALELLPPGAPWPVRLISTSSETLTAAMEDRIRSALRAPVADHYGQAERALAIQGCPAGGRHLVPDYGHGEVASGCWVGTPFFGRGAVLLRYATGDVAGPADAGACDCGWPFPLVGRVSGRSDDLIVTTDGRRVGRLGPAIGHLDGVEQVQVQQQAVGRLRVRVLLRPSALEDPTVRALRASLGALLADPDTDLEIRVGEPPVPGVGGKVRAVIGLADDPP